MLPLGQARVNIPDLKKYVSRSKVSVDFCSFSFNFGHSESDIVTIIGS